MIDFFHKYIIFWLCVRKHNNYIFFLNCFVTFHVYFLFFFWTFFSSRFCQCHNSVFYYYKNFLSISLLCDLIRVCKIMILISVIEKYIHLSCSVAARLIDDDVYFHINGALPRHYRRSAIDSRFAAGRKRMRRARAVRT